MASLATFVVRYRWWVIGAWIVVFVASATLAPRIGGALKQGFGEVDTESRLAVRQMVDALDVSESGVTLVFSSDRLEVSDPAYVAAMEDAIAPLREIPEVTRIVTFYSVPGEEIGATMVASDERTTYAFVELDAPIDESTALVEPIRDALADTELDVWVAGGVALFADITAYSEADLRRAELITVPLLAIALLIVFGGVVAAGLPVSMGLLSVSTTLALVFLMAQVTDMSVLTLNIATFLGLGMAVDYSLLMVTRFREEIGAATDGVQDGAAAIANRRFGHYADVRQGDSVLGRHVGNRAVGAAVLRLHDAAVAGRGRHYGHPILHANRADAAAGAVRGSGAARGRAFAVAQTANGRRGRLLVRTVAVGDAASVRHHRPRHRAASAAGRAVPGREAGRAVVVYTAG